MVLAGVAGTSKMFLFSGSDYLDPRLGLGGYGRLPHEITEGTSVTSRPCQRSIDPPTSYMITTGKLR